MISKLPRWVEIGSFGLAANAGAVNAIGLLGFKHQTVSNLTGTSSRVGVAVAELNLPDVTHLCLIILFFLLGAIVSGAIINNAVLQLGHRYSTVLIIEGCLFLLALLLMQQGSSMGYLLAAAACGLQNGMVSTYSGAIVRTSHVTGLITDLGTLLGAKLRGHPIGQRRLILYLLILFGFIIGGTIGAFSFHFMQLNSLLIPAGTAFAYAAAYWIYRNLSNKAVR